MIDPNNYLNDLWEVCTDVIKENFPDCRVITEPWDGASTIDMPTIIILYPRNTSFWRDETVYNGVGKVQFAVTVFCLSEVDGVARQLVTRVQTFVNKNQHLFSMKGLRYPKMDIVDIMDDGTDEVETYYGTLEGFVVL